MKKYLAMLLMVFSLGMFSLGCTPADDGGGGGGDPVGDTGGDDADDGTLDEVPDEDGTETDGIDEPTE